MTHKLVEGSTEAHHYHYTYDSLHQLQSVEEWGVDDVPIAGTLTT